MRRHIKLHIYAVVSATSRDYLSAWPSDIERLYQACNVHSFSINFHRLNNSHCTCRSKQLNDGSRYANAPKASRSSSLQLLSFIDWWWSSNTYMRYINTYQPLYRSLGENSHRAFGLNQVCSRKKVCRRRDDATVLNIAQKFTMSKIVC